MAGPDGDIPRSLNSDTPVYVNFYNRSHRSVFLFWINHSGVLVRYGHIPPRRGTAINTYETHPWVASDAVTGSPLYLDGSAIVYPKQTDDNTRRIMVWIDIPVYSLERRCMELIFGLYTEKTINQLDIPAQLKRKLERLSPTRNFSNYPKFNSIKYLKLASFGEIDDDGDDNDADGVDNNDAGV